MQNETATTATDGDGMNAADRLIEFTHGLRELYRVAGAIEAALDLPGVAHHVTVKPPMANIVSLLLRGEVEGLRLVGMQVGVSLDKAAGLRLTFKWLGEAPIGRMRGEPRSRLILGNKQTVGVDSEEPK